MFQLTFRLNSDVLKDEEWKEAEMLEPWAISGCSQVYILNFLGLDIYSECLKYFKWNPYSSGP